MQEGRAGDPVTPLRQAWLDNYGSDIFRRHHEIGNMRFQVPQAILDVLLLIHPRWNILGVRIRRLEHATRPGLHVQVVIAVVGADHLGTQPLAMKTGTETDDIASLGITQGKVNSRLRCLGTGYFKTEARQCLPWHHCSQLLYQRNTQRMLPLKTVLFMRLVHRLNNLRVTVTQRVGSPAIL